jgi:hypothetical protein
MSIEYAHEKLMQAVDALATGAGRVQERLHNAAIVLVRLQPNDFPEGELRRTFIGVLDDLTFEQATGDEGHIAATLRLTNDEDARAIAGRILHLYFETSRLAG